MSTSTRLDARLGARNSSRRSDDASAQCRLSNTSNSGAAAAARFQKLATASNRRNRACAASIIGGAGSQPGTRSRISGTISASAAASRAATRCTVSLSAPASQACTICCHGQYAGAPGSSLQRPQNTVMPRASACSARRSAVCVLPMPGSPASAAVPPAAARARVSKASRTASSRWRPTKRSLSGGSSATTAAASASSGAPQRSQNLASARQWRVQRVHCIGWALQANASGRTCETSITESAGRPLRRAASRMASALGAS